MAAHGGQHDPGKIAAAVGSRVIQVVTRILAQVLADLAAELSESSTEERLQAIAAVRGHVRRFEQACEEADAACASRREVACQAPENEPRGSAPRAEEGPRGRVPPEKKEPREGGVPASCSGQRQAPESEPRGSVSRAEEEPRGRAPREQEDPARPAGQSLKVGSWAKFRGLQSKPELNGGLCRILDFKTPPGAQLQKCSVRVPTTGQSVVVSCENLVAASAPMPRPLVRCNGGADELLAKLQAEVLWNLALVPADSVGSGTADGLSAIFGALAASRTFARDFFGRRPFVLECGEAAAHLWTQADQLALCAPEEEGREGRDPAEGSLLTLGPQCRFTHEGIQRQRVHSFCAVAEEESTLTAAAVRQRVRSSTWVFSGAEAVAPPVAELCEALQGATGLPFVSCNCYMSGLDLPVTAPMHTDRMDSFVVQTEGAKRWRVFDNSDELPAWPVPDACLPDRGKNGEVLVIQQAGPLLLDELLQPGDVLYLPRGLPHATSTYNTACFQGEEHLAKVSTSLTVSLLLETVGLTYDKLLRCAAGMADGRGVVGVESIGAEEVLEATKWHKGLRQVLPLGFLTPRGVPADAEASEELPPVEAFVEAVGAEAWKLAILCGCLRLLERGDEAEASLREIARYVHQRAEAAASRCRDAVFAGGRTQRARPRCRRQREGGEELANFSFYPEQGRIYTRPPQIRGFDGRRVASPMAAAAPGELPPGTPTE